MSYNNMKFVINGPVTIMVISFHFGIAFVTLVTDNQFDYIKPGTYNDVGSS